MKGRLRGCSSGRKKKKKEVCGGLLSLLPDDVFVDILAKLPRLDLVALATVSRRHRNIAACHELWSMRYRLKSVEPYMYVYMHMYPDPMPTLRRLKRIHPPPPRSFCPAAAPVEGSCFVRTDRGIYTIGGLLMDGKPTSGVTFFDCIDHKVYRVAPMKMARSGASASLIEERKIYVFGGCWDDDVTANCWVEVYDIHTKTWELLSVVSMPPKIKMPLKIKESMTMHEKNVYMVAEDGEIFFFSTSECRVLAAGGVKDSDPENHNDWRLYDETFICRGVGGRVLWRSLYKLGWNEVKGLEELQKQHIIKICAFPPDRIAIFWSQGPAYQTLELWFTEVSLKGHWETEDEFQLWGNIESSAAVFSDSSITAFHLLYADSFFL
ncbi:unnamed protein product [Eruca vesicaria subsp. sativa]|uniref:F-box domain-containing protein n=1 Tax=Eruca vesicaria subsp. sativa TaxID=29727 RepID=A0ABC8J8R3_ERUVS|nr:unnamed protein product [Eruca vesicaria subsp. sativa]